MRRVMGRGTPHTAALRIAAERATPAPARARAHPRRAGVRAGPCSIRLSTWSQARHRRSAPRCVDCAPGRWWRPFPQASRPSRARLPPGDPARRRSTRTGPSTCAVVARSSAREPDSEHRRRPEPQSRPGCGPETRRYECCSAPSRWHFSFRLGSRNGAHGDIHRNCPVRPRSCARGLLWHRTGGGDRPCGTGPKASACSLSRMRRRVGVPAERRGPHANPLHLGVSPRPGLSRRAAHKRSRPSMSTTEESVRTLPTIRFHRNDAQS